MPQAAAVWVSGWVGLAVSGTAGLIAGVVAGWGTYAVVAMGISYALTAVGTALMGRPKIGAPAQQDLVVKSPIANRSVIYGERTVGGVLLYINTCGPVNQFMDFVVAIAGHQVTEIGDVYFDDDVIPYADINSSNPAGGAVGGNGKYKPDSHGPRAYIYKYLGTEAQTASTVLSQVGDSGYNPYYDSDGNPHYEWTAQHRLQGVAYVHIRLVRDKQTFESGPPTNFRFRVKGAKVYDPRLDSTNGGAGTHRYTDATTWAYSNNWALCMADFITGGTVVNDVVTPVRKRGFGASPADVSWSHVIAAANISDEMVTVKPDSPVTQQKRYTCDGLVIPSDDSPDADCLEQLQTAGLGQVVCTNGIYKIYAGAYDVPTYTLTEKDLAGPLGNKTGTSRAERYNYVRGTRRDPELGIEVEFLGRTDDTYRTEDGRTLYRDIELPCTTNEYRAQRIGQIILRRSREMETLVWPGQMSCAKVAIWETVNVTCAELNISNKVFRCIGRKVRFNGSGPPVELTLREELSSTYVDPIVADYDDLTVTTPVELSPDQLYPPAGLTAESISGGILFRVTPDDRNASNVMYDIAEYDTASPPGGEVIWSAASTEMAVPKSDQVTRYYRVRARNNATVSPYFPSDTYVTGIALAAGQGPQGEPGESGPTVLLSTPSRTVVAYADGEVYPGQLDYAEGYFKVYIGGTDVSNQAVFSVLAQVGCTGTINTALNTPVAGEPAGYYRVTAMSADAATLSMRATYDGVNYDLNFTLTKALAGYKIVNQLPTDYLFDGRIVYLNTDGKLYRYTLTSSPAGWTAMVPAVDIDGQMVENQIADGAISIAKFASAVRPVEIVDAFPVTNLTEGMIVFKTDDNRLYRRVGSNWESMTVAASELVGTITTTQIADDAITTPKLAAGAVTANEIAADTITAGQIAAGAISASEIASGAVTTAKILVSSQGATLPDTTFEDTDAWKPGYGGTGTEASFKIITDAPAGRRVAYCPSGSASKNATWLPANTGTRQIPVDAAKRYRMTWWWRAPTSNGGNCYATVQQRDSAGAVIGGNGGHEFYLGSVLLASAAWVKNDVTFGSGTSYPLNAACRFVGPSFLLNWTGGTGEVQIADVHLDELVTGTLIQDGAITTNKIAANQITASHIQADAITTNKILAGAITSDRIQSGAITAGKIAAGAITVGSGIIADAVITNAMIDNLQVTTIKIANQAVTDTFVANWDFGPKQGKLGPAQTVNEWVPLVINGIQLQLVVTGIPSPSRVVVSVNWMSETSGMEPNMPEYCMMRVVRAHDGVILAGSPQWVMIGPITNSWQFIDEVPNSATTYYQVYINRLSGVDPIYIGRWYAASMLATIFKK